MDAIDVAAVARDVGELYEPLAEDKGLTFVLSVEPNLIVRGSRELIGQALANLVDNALKYGVREGMAATVELRGRRTDRMIEIVVADNGPGIASEDRARVLDRFVRLESARSRPGFGLGLSLVAAVAHLHGGSLHLEDNAPGLKAVLTLPALDENALPSLKQALPPPSSAAA
jgi:signal transduction histidine kinase